MPFVKGTTPWNKGLKGSQTSWNKDLTKETDTRVKMFSTALVGHPNFNTDLRGCFKKGHIPWSKGTGKDRYYNKIEYKELRKRVYERDEYTCLTCKKVGGKLTLHHVLPVSLFPEYAFNDDNVITLCLKCHTFTDTWGLRLVRKRDEFKESLSKVTLSQAREETLVKVQRLIAEAKANCYAGNANTSVPHESEEIVWPCEQSQEARDKEPLR